MKTFNVITKEVVMVEVHRFREYEIEAESEEEAKDKANVNTSGFKEWDKSQGEESLHDEEEIEDCDDITDYERCPVCYSHSLEVESSCDAKCDQCGQFVKCTECDEWKLENEPCPCEEDN